WSGSRCPADPGVPPIPDRPAVRALQRGRSAPAGRPGHGRGRRPPVARGCGGPPAWPCPRGLSGRCGVGWAREGRTDGRTEERKE
ncbi:hypothetical protein Nmel_004040, partial [Mimus melanotis]